MNQQVYPGEFLLHKKYARTETLLDLVWTHSNIIADVAIDLLDRSTFNTSELNREYVIQACLLHEIGVYVCGGFDWIPNQPIYARPYIQHGIAGAWILKQEGYSAPIVQAAYLHIGVGLSAEDIRTHGIELPQHDFFAQSTFQRFITYVSKFHSKAPKFRTNQEIRDSLAVFSPQKAEMFAALEAEFGIPNFPALEAKYQAWHAGFQFRVQELTKGKEPIKLSPAGLG